MILYKNSAIEFRNDVDDSSITDRIEEEYSRKMGRKASSGERMAWNNSMRFMETIVRKSQIPDDCGILVEYSIPSTSKRIDFVIAGHDESDSRNFLIIELKQWTEAEATGKDGLVLTYLNNGLHETTHPAYQAYSYKKYLKDMNVAVYKGDINAISCAYLHNYKKKKDEPLLREQYRKIIEDSPVFFNSDTERLERFVKKYVGKGKGLQILYEVENGKIHPSKKFIEYVSDIFRGNPVYTLLDEQKVAYSNILSIAAREKGKATVIVDGGPGTGKSVVAMNAFISLLQKNLNVRFVAPNSAFRECLVDTLAKHKVETKSRIKKLFSGSSVFVEAGLDDFDVIVCDEAHRLKKKGARWYSGESQIEDIVRVARVSVFFVDDFQAIRPDDEGKAARIEQVAAGYGSEVYKVRLESQFRCSGANGYINWVTHILQIADTGNYDGWEEGAFDFKLFDDPNELYAAVCRLNGEGFKARLLAGYAWPWTPEKEGNHNAEVEDVSIEEYGFRMPWNSRSCRESWATDPSMSNQVGCIHTSQGLEFDYVGVLIGNDLRYDPVKGLLYADYSNYHDTSGKKGLKGDNDTLTSYVKNIYRVLMTRGMRGCYVFCRDSSLKEYIKSRLS